MDNQNKDSLIRARIAAATERMVKAHTSPGGDRVEDIAEAMGMSRKALDHRMHGKSEGRDKPTPTTIQDVMALTKILKDDQLIQFTCGLCNGFFTPNPEEGDSRSPEATWERAMAMLALVTREAGEGISVSMEVLMDRIATPTEKAAVEKELNELMSAVGKLLSAVQSMPERDFSSTRRHSLAETRS